MPSHDAPWTIDRIGDALATPALRLQFLGEINRAAAHELLAVFARWQGVAQSITATVEEGRALLAEAGPDGELPGEWIDITDEVLADAERLRGRAA